MTFYCHSKAATVTYLSYTSFSSKLVARYEVAICANDMSRSGRVARMRSNDP